MGGFSNKVVAKSKSLWSFLLHTLDSTLDLTFGLDLDFCLTILIFRILTWTLTWQSQHYVPTIILRSQGVFPQIRKIFYRLMRIFSNDLVTNLWKPRNIVKNLEILRYLNKLWTEMIETSPKYWSYDPLSIDLISFSGLLVSSIPRFILTHWNIISRSKLL